MDRRADAPQGCSDRRRRVRRRFRQRHIPEKDGILANLLVLEMMEFEKKPFSKIWQDLVAEIGSDFVAKRADMHLSAATQKAFLEHLTKSPPASIAGEKVTKVGRSDGLKLYLDDFTFVLLRPSGHRANHAPQLRSARCRPPGKDHGGL